MGNNIVNLNDLNNYDDNSLDVISSKIMDVRIKKTQKKLEELQNVVIKNNEALNIRINDVDKKAAEAVEIGKAKAKIDEGYEGYISQGELGDKFQLKIGSRQVGDLLRIVGIAIKKSKITTPYHDKVPKYAKIRYQPDIYGNEHEQFVWNQSECMIAIDDWLEKHNKTKEFYSCTSTGKLAKYIKQLYSDFKNGLFNNAI